MQRKNNLTILNISIINMIGLPGGSAGKESACNVEELRLIPGLGRSPGEGIGFSLQYSGLDNFQGLYNPWGYKELTRLSDFHFRIINMGYLSI